MSICYHPSTASTLKESGIYLFFHLNIERYGGGGGCGPLIIQPTVLDKGLSWCSCVIGMPTPPISSCRKRYGQWENDTEVTLPALIRSPQNIIIPHRSCSPLIGVTEPVVSGPLPDFQALSFRSLNISNFFVYFFKK